MKKKMIKKLRLHRETLRSLSGEDLMRAQGGSDSCDTCILCTYVCGGGSGDLGCGDASKGRDSCPGYCVYDPV